MRLSCRFLLTLALLTACTTVEKKGVLVDVEPGTPMDESDLRQHCDLGDLAACALAGLNNVPLPPARLSLVQGVAPSDHAVFAALVPKGANLSWFVFDRSIPSLTKVFTPKPVARGSSRWALQRIDARGLLPNREYELLAGSPDGQLLEDRKFRTLDIDARNLRFVVLSGWRFGTAKERASLLEQALALKPQLLVMGGSAVDASLPEKLSALKGKAASDYFFERHAESRASLELGMLRELLPVGVLWNDDEFGRAGGDRSFPQRDQAREQLESFFPHWADESTIVDGPGISLSIDFRRQELALVDDLTFRQAPSPGEPVCTKPKGRKKEVCRPGKPVPAPVGSRYGTILRGWIAGRSVKAPQPLWLLMGGPAVRAYRDDWFEDAGLNVSPANKPLPAIHATAFTSDGSGNLVPEATFAPLRK